MSSRCRFCCADATAPSAACPTWSGRADRACCVSTLREARRLRAAAALVSRCACLASSLRAALQALFGSSLLALSLLRLLAKVGTPLALSETIKVPCTLDGISRRSSELFGRAFRSHGRDRLRNTRAVSSTYVLTSKDHVKESEAARTGKAVKAHARARKATCRGNKCWHGKPRHDSTQNSSQGCIVTVYALEAEHRGSGSFQC